MPVGFANLEGGASNIFPFSCAPALTEIRYMQVYDGQQVGTGYITELRFRQDGTDGMDFPPTNLPSPVIVLSSTASPVDGLDPFFGANFGSDFKLVWNGENAISSTSDGGDPPHFDIIIRLTEAFRFDAAAGQNLLMDVVLFSCVSTTPFDAVASSSDGVSRMFVSPFTEPTATDIDTLGLVTEFVFDPDLLFLDGFESGDTSLWSDVAP